MADYISSIDQLLDEMIKQQETKVLKIAHEILPNTTPVKVRKRA